MARPPSRRAMKTIMSTALAIRRLGGVARASMQRSSRRSERVGGGIGVQRQKPAGMAGVPGFQHFERCAIAHFADDDAVGPKAQCHLHEIAHGDRRLGALGQQLHRVGAGALQFGGVFEDDDARLRRTQARRAAR